MFNLRFCTQNDLQQEYRNKNYSINTIQRKEEEKKTMKNKNKKGKKPTQKNDCLKFFCFLLFFLTMTYTL